MAEPVTPELLLVEDVPAAFATIVAAAVAARVDATGEAPRGPFALGLSGGSTGRACAVALATSPVRLADVALYGVDERCVEPTSPDANEQTLREALGPRLDELAAFHPMRCADGPEAYEALLRRAGRLDLVQLGVGPDGHTASLFPGSAGLEAPAGRLVVANRDPSGANAHNRLSLTFEALGEAGLLVVAVFGAAKRDVLTRLQDGAALPAQEIPPERAVWLVDREAAGGLATRAVGQDELVELGRTKR